MPPDSTRSQAADYFSAVLEAAPVGMLVVDNAGTIAFANSHIEQLFGYSRGELVGSPLERMLPPRIRDKHGQLHTAFLTEPRARAMGGGRDLFGLRKDGVEMPVEIGLSPATIDGTEYVVASVVDLTERNQSLLRLKEQSAALTATLQEREVLLREIHHRVKNNLQIIGSLINMQMRGLQSRESIEVLSECKTRVDAIALIHEKLYQSRDFSSIPFATYARGLMASVCQAAGAALQHVRTEVRVDEITLPVDQAICCGLIVNELVTNAMKHAFPQQRAGLICVSLHRLDPQTLRLRVTDDGVGMEEFRATAERDSIGLRLVGSLADQLDGVLRVVSSPGVHVTVDFPL